MTLLHIRFSNQYELTSTFLRFQEFYESPRFKDEVFTHEEYFDWYAKEYGNMTYYSDWNGFNLPSHVFSKFMHIGFSSLWKKEEKLLEYIQNLKRPFYIIGTYQEDELIHEAVHGLYYLTPLYRMQVIDAIALLDANVYDQLQTAICNKGYNKSVFTDEANAFCITESPTSSEFPKWLPKQAANKANSILCPIFVKHFGFDPKIEPTQVEQYVTNIKWEDIT